MTPHERFLACMRFEAVDRCPLLEWRPWPAPVARWQSETGLDEAALLRPYQECSPGVDFSMIPP